MHPGCFAPKHHALRMGDFALHMSGMKPLCTGIFAFRSYGTLRMSPCAGISPPGMLRDTHPAPAGCYEHDSKLLL